MSEIRSVKGREVLDSRGIPTVSAEVRLASGSVGEAMVPSGASTGSAEAVERRDGDPKRYLGKGVLKAVAAVNGEIADSLRGKSADDQEQLDGILIQLDGTQNCGRLGANAMLAVSLAAVKAMAAEKAVPLWRYLAGQEGLKSVRLPVPMMNIINGGAHADNPLDIQEFMILPVGAPDFAEALRSGAEIFQHLKKLLQERHLGTRVGDEGGFAPDLAATKAALDLIMLAIERAGYRAGEEIFLGLDVAATELFQEGKYHLPGEKAVFSPAEFVDWQADLAAKYPLLSIEDGMAEKDDEGWRLLTAKLGKKLQLVGDDVFVTNVKLLARGIREGMANALLVKPNQIGTLTGTLAAIRMARQAHYGIVLSHRSGETEDTTIADIAVGMDAGQIKTGSLCRSDRVAKYNRLLQIAEEAKEMGASGRYAGRAVYNNEKNANSEVTG